jgi:mono/diheme cytochrome c family protein
MKKVFRSCLTATGVLTLLLCAQTVFAQTAPASAAPAPIDRSNMTGEQLYRSACAACHAPDGRGQPQSVVGFDAPLPDFTSCSFTTPEADADWSSVVHRGGRIRALDHRMPSFIDALTDDEIDRVIGYVRGFCTQRGWPRGDLNFPRAFFTEKAFPENEAVLTTTVANDELSAITNEFLYEHRIGRRAQYEVNVPFAAQEAGTGGWNRGLGDVNVALKYALFDSLRHGFILSGGGEVTLPTGKESEGLGGGATILEGFGMFGKSLPSDGFLHFHAGFEAPTDSEKGAKEMYWRTAVGKTFAADNGFGRSWSPMIEILGAKELEEGVAAEWDVVPQLQVSLSGLQHVLVAAGVRVPVTERDARSSSVVVYLLWDWFDGGLFSNWK